MRVLTIGEDEPLVNYAKAIVQELRANMVRAEGDYTTNKINGKIQQAEQAKVHTMLVIGPRDMEPATSPSASTAKATSAPSRRRKWWRTSWRRSTSGGRSV